MLIKRESSVGESSTFLEGVSVWAALAALSSRPTPFALGTGGGVLPAGVLDRGVEVIRNYQKTIFHFQDHFTQEVVVEQRFPKPKVTGSSPVVTAIKSKTYVGVLRTGRSGVTPSMLQTKWRQTGH